MELNPYDWQFHEDPYPVYRWLRRHAPVYHNERLGFWALSRHADVLAAFLDPAAFSSAEGVALETSGAEARAAMSFLAMDPPRHDRLRALVARGFTPRRMAALEPNIRFLARRYLAGFSERGACDFIDEFAGRLPMDVISEMIGVPAEDRETLRGWADTVVHREPGRAEVPRRGLEAAAQLFDYFRRHIERRRREPRDDLTGALLRAEVDGDRLSEEEILAFLFLMIIAGNETTTKLLGNALYWLWRNPDQRRRVVADRSCIPLWVEETLRYDPSSQIVARTTRRDVVLHGCRIPAGARVALLIGSANRDEAVFPEPDRYDILRDTRRSLAFGHGTHFCMGASLARLEARVSLEEVMAVLPDYEIDESGARRVHSSNVRGFARLPLRFRPVAAGRVASAG